MSDFDQLLADLQDEQLKLLEELAESLDKVINNQEQTVDMLQNEVKRLKEKV